MDLKTYDALIEKKTITEYILNQLKNNIKETEKNILDRNAKIKSSEETIKIILIAAVFAVVIGVFIAPMIAKTLPFKIILSIAVVVGGTIFLAFYLWEKMNQKIYKREIQVAKSRVMKYENELKKKEKEFKSILSELYSLTKEEKKELKAALNLKSIEENLMKMEYELGKSFQDFQKEQDQIKKRYQKESLEEARGKLIIPKKQDSFKKQLELAYKLGADELNDEISNYTEEEIQKLEETLDLEILKNYIEAE